MSLPTPFVDNYRQLVLVVEINISLYGVAVVFTMRSMYMGFVDL